MIEVQLNSDWLDFQAFHHPNTTAVIERSKSLSYKELRDEVRNFTNALSRMEFSSQNIVVIPAHNLNFIIFIFSLWRLGLTPVVMNSRLTKSEIISNIETINTDIIFYDSSLNKGLEKLSRNYKLIDYSNLKVQSNDKESPKSTALHDALMLFTSGSRGHPKVVNLSFDALYHNAMGVDSIAPHKPGDKWLASLPFYHIGGFAIIIRSIVTSSTIVIPKSFEINEIISSIDKYSIKSASLVSTTLKRMLEKVYSPPKSLTNIFVGGGHISNELIQRGLSAGYNLIKVYGSTETCSMVAASTPYDLRKKPASAGKPLLDNEIKILDEQNNLLPPNQTGEIAVKSKALMNGYFGNPSATKDKFHNSFYLTGDLGWLDEEGYLYIAGRKDDVIITGGENVNPIEIEEVIKSHSQINDAIIFGVRDSEWSEKIVSAVVLQGRGNLTDLQLKDYLRKRLAGFKVPKEIYFMEELPKTSLGKIDIHKLKSILNLA